MTLYHVKLLTRRNSKK